MNNLMGDYYISLFSSQNQISMCSSTKLIANNCKVYKNIFIFVLQEYNMITIIFTEEYMLCLWSWPIREPLSLLLVEQILCLRG
jgi:hypothetical protein